MSRLINIVCFVYVWYDQKLAAMTFNECEMERDKYLDHIGHVFIQRCFNREFLLLKMVISKFNNDENDFRINCIFENVNHNTHKIYIEPLSEVIRGTFYRKPYIQPDGTFQQ